MCTVSMVGDYWRDRTLPEKYPNWPSIIEIGPTRAEFEELRRMVEELKRLLIAANKYDEAMGEPHCEHEDKVALIKKIAEMVGVDLKGVI